MSEMERSITHELIHTYDYIYGKCDFNTVDGLAYTEIRAAREGECYDIKRNYFQFQKDNCIKNHAIQSTSNMYPLSTSTDAVRKGYSTAYNDNSPFADTAIYGSTYGTNSNK